MRFSIQSNFHVHENIDEPFECLPLEVNAAQVARHYDTQRGNVSDVEEDLAEQGEVRFERSYFVNDVFPEPLLNQ